jgi:cell wall-associated NlpC family hydrolase
LEAILNGILRRAGMLAVAALVLVSAPELLHRQPATPAPTANAVTQLLVLRPQPAAASRATSALRAQPVARKQLTKAQSRAALLTQRRASVVRFVRAQRGKWYQYGATGMRRFDCSGLTQRSMRAAGVKLPRTSGAQRRAGVRVSAGNARVGDLVSYNGHIGILVGKWTMVDAPGSGRRIVERRIYRGNGLQFRRVIR